MFSLGRIAGYAKAIPIDDPKQIPRGHGFGIALKMLTRFLIINGPSNTVEVHEPQFRFHRGVWGTILRRFLNRLKHLIRR